MCLYAGYINLNREDEKKYVKYAIFFFFFGGGGGNNKTVKIFSSPNDIWPCGLFS